MIKKYLAVIALLLMGIMCHAQSLSLAELQSLTVMNDDQLHNYLIISKGFKGLGKTTINGFTYERFRSNRTNPSKAETISVGDNFRGASGNSARKVIYYTPRMEDMDSLYSEAKRSSMTLIFKGADVYQHIFRFDNSLFMATISVSRDRRSGTVQIDEK